MQCTYYWLGGFVIKIHLRSNRHSSMKELGLVWLAWCSQVTSRRGLPHPLETETDLSIIDLYASQTSRASDGKPLFRINICCQYFYFIHLRWPPNCCRGYKEYPKHENSFFKEMPEMFIDRYFCNKLSEFISPFSFLSCGFCSSQANREWAKNKKRI